LNRKELFGIWRHSHEEDDDRRVVYRRSGAALPPSRGRDALDLQSDGKAVRVTTNAADRPTPHECGWRVDGDDVVLVDGDLELRRMHVLELTPDRIVFEKRR